jgi:hypothetical protein
VFSCYSTVHRLSSGGGERHARKKEVAHMKRIILVLAMLAMLTLVAVMALPATAQPWGGDDDHSRGDDYGSSYHDDGHDDGHGDYDRGYDDEGYDAWWDWFFYPESCGEYWSIWGGTEYWCWSPLLGWVQLW